MEALSGYKLVDENGTVHKAWGGGYGQVPGIPNPLMLPNGDHVHAPLVDADYSGFRLVPWLVAAPAPTPPESITRRQCALELHARKIVTLDEALAMVKAASVPAAISAIFDVQVEHKVWTAEQRTLAEIDFAANNYYRENSLLGLMGLTPEQIDEFFISAAGR